MNTLKKYFAFCICLIILSVGFVSNAHEIYFKCTTSSSPAYKYPLRWTKKSSSGGSYVLSTNADYLYRAYNPITREPAFSSPLLNNYSPAISKWTSSNAPVAINSISFSYADVVISTPATSTWEGLGLVPDTYAITLLCNTNNTWLNPKQTITSPQNIKFCRIYANPYSNARIYTISEDLQTETLAHELGHVMGLGHSTQYYRETYDSLMVQGSDLIHGITTHDIKDVTRALLGYTTEGETYDSTGKVGGMIMPL